MVDLQKGESIERMAGSFPRAGPYSGGGFLGGGNESWIRKRGGVISAMDSRHQDTWEGQLSSFVSGALPRGRSRVIGNWSGRCCLIFRVRRGGNHQGLNGSGEYAMIARHMGLCLVGKRKSTKDRRTAFDLASRETEREMLGGLGAGSWLCVEQFTKQSSRSPRRVPPVPEQALSDWNLENSIREQASIGAIRSSRLALPGGTLYLSFLEGKDEKGWIASGVVIRGVGRWMVRTFGAGDLCR